MIRLYRWDARKWEEYVCISWDARKWELYVEGYCFHQNHYSIRMTKVLYTEVLCRCQLDALLGMDICGPDIQHSTWQIHLLSLVSNNFSNEYLAPVN